MAMISRTGTGLLLAGGMLLAMLMGYTLLLDEIFSRPVSAPRLAGVADVAVFYPGRDDWHEFRQGIAACVRRGLTRIVQEGDATVVLETPQHGRPVRFSWQGSRGLVETREEVRRLVPRVAPVALVGSTNTVMTVALARELRDSLRDSPRGPVLLVPWATSVLVEAPDHASGRVPLLAIWPGRTFRFCPNNQREASLVVRCVAEHEPGPQSEAMPRRVVIVVDRNDPYSEDLADCFRRAIKEVAPPEVEIIDHDDALSAPSLGGRDEVPGRAERQQAEEIWKEVAEAPAGRASWVILPLQSRPARRMLTALRDQARYAPAPAVGRLHVLCGDGIGLETLSEIVRTAGRAGDGLEFPIWCVSSTSIPAPEPASTPIDSATQIQAEIVSAVIRGLDRPRGSGEDLRHALATLSLAAGEPGAMGRSLAFTDLGERKGDDLGHVLTIQPGQDKVLAYARVGGRWGQPVALAPVSDRR